MEMAETKLVLRGRSRRHKNKVAHVDGMRIRFSAHQCFAWDGGEDDLRCLRILTDYLASQPGLGVCIEGDGRFFQYILEHFPRFRDHVRCVIVENYTVDGRADFERLPLLTAEEIPSDVHTIFLCDTRAYPRMRMRQWLHAGTRFIEPDLLPELALEHLPARAWVPWSRDIIYPLDLPDFEFQPGMDLIVIDCPARNLGLMPNGLGYVHNALKRVEVRYQTCDLDILIYHRFHIRRLCDEGGKITLVGGRELPTDPWQAEHYDLWCEDEVIAYFEPEIREIVAKLVVARPKVLGLSIHACNEKFSAKVVERVKAALPELIIVVGGYACYSPDIGLRGFPLADYMCVGEADLTVGPLVDRLANGERPANIPGVLSKFDQPGMPFLPAPMVHDLDLLDHPKYEWYDLQVYRNYNGYQLTPIIASRGCRWSRCTFCAERFYWRIRSAKAFVDEMAWLVEHGCRLFMFNESDLNGKPEAVLEICDEIIRRGLQVKLTGQLRIHRKCDLAYFKKLRQAGFVALRFGIDAFSENTLRLQKKGYTTATVRQNLKDCWQAGIFSEVNWVIGVPGETEEDIDESIALILENKPYIGRLANINPLILVTGGVYWMEPEKHNIHFRGNKDELYAAHPRALPAHLWYSTEPYIDENVRKARFERIVLALHEGNFHVGVWAKRIIEDVKHNRDPNRAGPRSTTTRADCADRNATADAGSSTPEPNVPRRGKLSDGVGGMEKPSQPEDGGLEFNADARSAAYVFRAGSSLPEDKTHCFRSPVCVVSFRGALFGIEPQALESAFGGTRSDKSEVRRQESANNLIPDSCWSATLDVRQRFEVILAKTKAAVPELVAVVGCYNIVSYDNRCYGVPQSFSRALSRLLEKRLRANDSNLQAMRRPYPVRLVRRAVRIVLDVAKNLRRGGRDGVLTGSMPWGDLDLEGLPGIITGASVTQVIAEVERLLGLDQSSGRSSRAANSDLKVSSIRVTAPSHRKGTPVLVGSLAEHNIVEYEGWFYGIPKSLGDIRLEDVDVIEMPGVIRDVSREVVEGEIRELTLQT
jgi:radical SAM superfamily enzyme YgiQ (UPF0313 family)